MGSSCHNFETRNLRYYNEILLLKQIIPNAITSLRLLVLPHLVYSFNHQITLVAYTLFLFSIGTDLVDGYVARKLGSASKLGSYFDITFDFIFIAGMYLTFTIKGLYSPWILITIFFVFGQLFLKLIRNFAWPALQ